MTKPEIKTIVNKYYWTLRHLIVNVLKADNIGDWNNQVPIETIDEITSIIFASFSGTDRLRREDDINKLCNIYYAGFSKAIIIMEATKKLT